LKPWLREALRIGLGLVALAASIAWLSGACTEKIEPDAPGAPGQGGEAGEAGEVVPADAPTAPVEAVRGPVSERASGTLVSARQTAVSSKILARIEAVLVSAGSVVERGDELVRLDARDLEARAREAEEAVRSARAQLELARTEESRVRELFGAGVGTQQALDRAVSALEVATANLQAAEQRLADARVALSYGSIRSPVAGRVVDRLAEPGDTATPGVPLLRIYDPGALRLEVPVRESLAVRLRPGDALRVTIDALGARFEGRIDEVVPFAEPGARTLLVKVRLPNDPRLFAGMFGRLDVPAGDRRRLLIPREAVARIGQLDFVRVVGEDGRSRRRLVTLGPEEPAGGPAGSEEAERVEVLSGLSEGERVLLPEEA
jgi:membrane fusion protein (multidrug efflux system)